MNNVYIVFKTHPNIKDKIILVCDDKKLIKQYKNKREYYIEMHEVLTCNE